MAILVNLNSKIINPPTTPAREWIGQRPEHVTPQLIEQHMARGRATFLAGDTRISLDTIYELAGYDEAAIQFEAQAEAAIAEYEAEVAFWRQKRLAAQIVAMFGEEEYRAAVDLADLQDGMADDEWHARGQW